MKAPVNTVVSLLHYEAFETDLTEAFRKIYEEESK